MTDAVVRVTDARSLEDAIARRVPVIEVLGHIRDLASTRLPAGTRLRGVEGAELHFRAGQPGLMLSADHEVTGLRLAVDETQIALGLADDVSSLGTLTLSHIRTVGRFHLEASQARQGHIRLSDIHVERADARLAAHRPAGFGVEVLLGGLTIYNASKDKESRWTLDAENLSGGSQGQPLRGGGVFVFGGWYIPADADFSKAPAPTEPGGSIEVRRLTTGEIHADGGIPPGTANLITGGVFVGSGVHAHSVVNTGPVTTYGPNDMVLDNWGKVDGWVAQAPVTSHGPSGIGFVNFGDIDTLEVQAPIETHGLGARGFNLYDGSLNKAVFQNIATYGDGSIGVQLSKPFGSITVAKDIRTKGGEGESLVRGRVLRLKAHALSLKDGARGNELIVGGDVVAENPDISDYEFQAPASVVRLIKVGGQTIS